MESYADELLISKVRFRELPTPSWQKSVPTRLSPGTTEVWRFCLPSYVDQLQGLYQLLGTDEKAKSAKFYKEKDRQMFIAGKALLRLLLGKYLNIDSRELSFISGENMKPSLSKTFSPPIHFNISHSGQCLLIAVSGDEVGIDVEQYENKALVKAEMDYLFTNTEISFINNHLSPVKTFYRLWTRKEALLKATSRGVSDDIKYLPCLNGTHVIGHTILNSVKNWGVCNFDADHNYAASIAYTPANKKLIFKELNGFK
ncbi:MAG: 4'-phosphopantetheinyl transferase superfamily protein [Daejeonella sp.]